MVRKRHPKTWGMNCRRNIQSFQEEVDASVYAKLSAFFEIERENVSSSSHESDEVAIKPRKELQEHKEEKMTAKIVADAKQENLGK